MGKTAEGDVGLAFAFVFAAGLATTVGSTFAFCSSLADQRFLAAALGCSAGVMLYVSFGEIFMAKAVGAFEDHGYSDDEAMRYATFCFFGGIALTALLDKLVHMVTGMSSKNNALAQRATEGPESLTYHENPLNGDGGQAMHQIRTTASEQQLVEQLDKTDEERANQNTMPMDKLSHSKSELHRMGLLTGLAIALHNFPEGLATFVATLADTTVGAAIALAIALHNIPEGVCVAMPIYYATGSRWKGFWWSVASGVSEPLGGLMGYLVLYGDNMSDLAYGSLFGVVAGMMVYISVVELIPTALKYDPDDKYVTTSVLVGMAVMAASLLLFVL